MSYNDNFMERLVSDAFQVMYMYSNVWNGGNTKWLGVGVLNNPLDMWVKQELIFDVKPTLIIETGSSTGGSSLYFATILDQIGEGRIVSIDLQEKDSPMGKPSHKHKRVTFIKANSVGPTTIKNIKSMIKPKDKVMVFLDSDHSMEHVFKELNLYGPLVSPGSYMIVDDTNLGGHPIYNPTVPGPGPYGAVEKFMEGNKEFEIDISRHKFFMTWSINGFLRKKE